MTDRELECRIFLLFAEVLEMAAGSITAAEMLSIREFDTLDRVDAAFLGRVPEKGWIELQFRDGERYRLRLERLNEGNNQ